MEFEIDDIKKNVNSYFLGNLSKEELGKWAKIAYYDLLKGEYLEIKKIIGNCEFVLSETGKADELAFVTPVKKERELLSDIEKISKLDAVDEVLSTIRKIK